MPSTHLHHKIISVPYYILAIFTLSMSPTHPRHKITHVPHYIVAILILSMLRHTNNPCTILHNLSILTLSMPHHSNNPCTILHNLSILTLSMSPTHPRHKITSLPYYITSAFKHYPFHPHTHVTQITVYHITKPLHTYIIPATYTPMSHK